MYRKSLTVVLVALSVLFAAAGSTATLEEFDPGGKPLTKGFVAVQAFRWLRDNAPDAIGGCDKNIDQYADLHQEGVSQFKREAINGLASVGFFDDWPGLEVAAGGTGEFDPNGKPPTNGFVAVQAFRWLRDNGSDVVAGCDKDTDQYADVDQEGVSQFKREAINCLASIGFFNDWPGLAVTTTTTTTTSTTTVGPTLSDEEIRQALIRESIGAYSGSCPCPYSTDRAGRRCGGRSAHSRAGGASPLCYVSDITQDMIENYRQRAR